MSVQAEAAVLGAALTSDAKADQALDLVDVGDLQRDAHRTVYDTIAELRRKGETADTITVTRTLARREKLDEVGGAGAISDLAGQAPYSMPVSAWAKVIADTARRRKMASTIEQLRAEVYSTDDLDSLLDDAIQELSTAGPVQVRTPEAIGDAFDVRLEHGVDIAGYRLPWPQLEFRIPDDGLTIVTGLPGSGKSTWVDAVMAQLMADVPVAFFSPEQSPADHHLYLLVNTLMGANPRTDRSEAKAQSKWVLDRCFWIDDDRDCSPQAVMAAARRLVRDQGVKVLVIDPYNNLEPDYGATDGRQDLYIQSLLRRLRRFARSEGVAVVVVAHPRRTEKIAGTDAVFRVPTAADISGGQEWWNHADLVLSVWRNQSGEEPKHFGDPSLVKVVASKVRFGKWGRTGKGTLTFDETARQYE